MDVSGHAGRISGLTPDGHQTALLDNVPGPGTYHTNMVAFGSGGILSFSRG
jgi:hypothetical protein